MTLRRRRDLAVRCRPRHTRTVTVTVTVTSPPQAPVEPASGLGKSGRHAPSAPWPPEGGLRISGTPEALNLKFAGLLARALRTASSLSWGDKELRLFTVVPLNVDHYNNRAVV